MTPAGASTYSKAGVDVARIKKLHERLAGKLAETYANRSGRTGFPLLPIGHYAGVVEIGGGMALTLHTDGVGTKVILAQEMGKFDTVGIDCVAMTVNDLVCLGSEPVALLDYIALERQDDGLVSELVKGIVEGCRRASVALVGGETAVMGDVIRGVNGRGFDLVSMGVGLVAKDRIVDGSAIVTGDVVVGVESSGLHSNGYTLARKVLSRHPLGERVRGFDSTLGDALLTPTEIYVEPVLEAVRKSEVHGIGHITGGGFSKLTRLVGDRRLTFDLTLPPTPPIFELLRKEGKVSWREMFRTFNMGVGLCLFMPEGEERRVERIFRKNGFESLLLGKVKEGRGVRVNGVRVS